MRSGNWSTLYDICVLCALFIDNLKGCESLPWSGSLNYTVPSFDLWEWGLFGNDCFYDFFGVLFKRQSVWLLFFHQDIISINSIGKRPTFGRKNKYWPWRISLTHDLWNMHRIFSIGFEGLPILAKYLQIIEVQPWQRSKDPHCHCQYKPQQKKNLEKIASKPALPQR